jgi:scyllo-inositol 2-dehydrogenase (NAD+)
MGRLHAQNVTRYIRDAKVVAVADVDKSRAASLAEVVGAGRVYDDTATLIEDSRVRAVIVTTPAVTHEELVVKCAQAGKDVFCEKPLATTVDGARRAGRAAADHGIRLQVGFMRRFDPTYLFAKEAIDSGAIGTPLVYKGITRDRLAPPRAYLSLTARNGLLVDTGVHEFDTARWLLGDEVVRVQAMGDVLANREVADVQGPDAIVVNMRFSRGGLSNVDLFWGVRYGDDVRAEVIGSTGSISIGTTARVPVRVMTEAGLVQRGYLDHFDRFGDSYLAEMVAFVEAIRDDHESTAAAADDGIKSVEIAAAAERSMAQHMAAVDLPL